MKFDDLDKKMRVFETSNDLCIVPEIFIIARIDGRSFTKLTKEKQDFERPFDIRFRAMMVETVKHLMNCGFKITYGYTQSDEISLLLDFNENSFQRKERKINSVLAGEASAKFSLLLNDVGAFDCRLCQIPSKSLVVDYFRWRNEDAHRNALNAYCYWKMRDEGLSPDDANKNMSGISVSDKNELLFKKGINFNDVPNWQKRGIGIYWEDYIKKSVNPKTGENVEAKRKKLKVDYDLPMKDQYSIFMNNLISDNGK